MKDAIFINDEVKHYFVERSKKIEGEIVSCLFMLEEHSKYKHGFGWHGIISGLEMENKISSNFYTSVVQWFNTEFRFRFAITRSEWNNYCSQANYIEKEISKISLPLNE